MDKLRKSVDLDYSEVWHFIESQEKTVDGLVFWHESILVDNEDGQLVLVQAEKHDCTIVLVVTDLLETGWMIENCFLPDGTITRNKTR